MTSAQSTMNASVLCCEVHHESSQMNCFVGILLCCQQQAKNQKGRLPQVVTYDSLGTNITETNMALGHLISRVGSKVLRGRPKAKFKIILTELKLKDEQTAK